MPSQGTTTDRPGPARKPGPATRRRGAQLEAALLDAAWSELTEVGYGAFTMEGVAARAKTSRAVLYRRWPNRTELAVAAMRHRTQLAATEIPDTGTLRDDVLALLRHLSERGGEVAVVFSFVIADYFDQTGLSLAELRERALAGRPSAMHTVLDRAVARGEIDPGRLTPRIASLPVDLVRHDLIMNRSHIPDPALIDIVDNLFLPLVHAEPRTQPRSTPRPRRSLPGSDRPGDPR